MIVINLLVIIFFVMMVLYFRSLLMIAGIILGLVAFVLEYREKREIRARLE